MLGGRRTVLGIAKGRIMWRSIFIISLALATPDFARAQDTTATGGNPHRPGAVTETTETVVEDETTETAAPAAATGTQRRRVERTTETRTENQGVTTGRVESENAMGDAGGFFAEPFVAIGQDSTSVEGMAAVDNEGTIQHVTAGARLGIHVSEVVFGGLDGRYSRAEFKDTFYGDSSGNIVNVGPMAGVQFPDLGLRAWGTYVLLGNYDLESGSQGADIDFSDPRGFRVGAGYRFSAVSLNVEYENYSWKDSTVEAGGAGVSSADEIDLDNEGFNVSLSFPIEL